MRTVNAATFAVLFSTLFSGLPFIRVNVSYHGIKLLRSQFHALHSYYVKMEFPFLKIVIVDVSVCFCTCFVKWRQQKKAKHSDCFSWKSTHCVSGKSAQHFILEIYTSNIMAS